MKKLKSSFSGKPKAAVDAHVEPLRDDDHAADNLVSKQSVAKLRRVVEGSSSVNQRNFEGHLDTAMEPPVIRPAKRVDSGVSSSADSQGKVEMVRVPYGMYGFREVPKSSITKPAVKPVAVGNADDKASARKQSIFGAFKKKHAVKPLDNFTMWNKSKENVARTSDGTSYHTANETPDKENSISSSQLVEVDADPYEDSFSVRQSWAAYPKIVKSSKGKGKQPVLPRPRFRDKDVNHHHDVRARANSSGSLALIDSSVSMMSDEEKAKQIAVPAEGEAGPSFTQAERDEQHDDWINMDQVLAKEAALRLEMDELQRHWADALSAIEAQKEAVLERQRQEEEDRQRALEIQAEEERRIRAAEIQAEEERIAAEVARMLECVCCGDSKNPIDFNPMPATETCEHDSLTCKECMESWLSSEFDTKGAESIKCPECPSQLSYEDMQRLASEELFDKYEKMLTRNALASLPEFSWCLASGCTSGQLNAENANFMDCVACGYKQCLTHKCPWHVGETCDQYTYRTSGQQAKDEEAATEAMLDAVSKLCPGPKGKACGWRIQKIDGCDHMTCRTCKHEFCWECLASHREIKDVGNTAHKEWLGIWMLLGLLMRMLDEEEEGIVHVWGSMRQPSWSISGVNKSDQPKV
ncbi:hypothetical protein AC579_936 [Pseudocercospora musae]|uniref:RBR-type E3 ubiquitin transferase n=1 Tax=Pseudocercospora musae TaxID=113226 RepID=A0A139IUL4_9PEZI|nr:hypothetical protein AC579_936 [Pseudocercospora musae]